MLFKKIKKKEKEINKINLNENIKLLTTNDLLYIRNMVIFELRKRGVKHV